MEIVWIEIINIIDDVWCSTCSTNVVKVNIIQVFFILDDTKCTLIVKIATLNQETQSYKTNKTKDQPLVQNADLSIDIKVLKLS